MNVRTLPGAYTRPAAPVTSETWPSTHTLSQARPFLIEITTFTPLNATVTFRVSEVDLPSALVAVTVIAHFPVVSSSGVLNEPSSAGLTVTGLGAGGGAGVAFVDALPSAGPEYAALTTTDVAFVACPWTGIAPFSTVAPSAGWSTVSAGASVTVNGTVM